MLLKMYKFLIKKEQQFFLKDTIDMLNTEKVLYLKPKRELKKLVDIQRKFPRNQYWLKDQFLNF